MNTQENKPKFWKKIFKNSNIRKQISIGLILSVLISSIIIIGYCIHAKPVAIWAALCAVQIGMALLWWIFKAGFASTSRHAMRNSSRQMLNRKTTKKQEEQKYLLKRSNSPLELEEKDAKKSRAGIYTMLIIGAIYIIVTLIVTLV